jgi:hypothetical protein
VDPLVCKGCGGPLNIVAYINDQEEPSRGTFRVPVDDEGRANLAG